MKKITRNGLDLETIKKLEKGRKDLIDGYNELHGPSFEALVLFSVTISVLAIFILEFFCKDIF